LKIDAAALAVINGIDGLKMKEDFTEQINFYAQCTRDAIESTFSLVQVAQEAIQRAIDAADTIGGNYQKQTKEGIDIVVKSVKAATDDSKINDDNKAVKAGTIANSGVSKAMKSN